MFQVTDNTTVSVIDKRWFAWNRKRVINGDIGIGTHAISLIVAKRFFEYFKEFDFYEKWLDCEGFFKLYYLENEETLIFRFRDFQYDGATFINDWFPLITKAAAVHDALLRDECSKRIGTHYDMYSHYIMYIIIASKHPKSAYAILLGLMLFYPLYISLGNLKDKVKRLFKRG